MDAEALRCVYCSQVITADDDAQRIERKKYAHTVCAWRVNDEFFAGLNAKEERDDDAA